MQCTACGGNLEFAPNGSAARCLRCQQLFQLEDGHITPLQVQAPGGGNDPAFTAIFAQQLGFGPPGSNPTTPPGGGGGGSDIPDVRLRVHVPGMTSFDIGTKGASIDGDKLQRNLEKKVKDKISGFLWGLAILGVMLVVLAGVGIYVWLSWDKKPSTEATAAKWDGKSAYECSNGNVKLEGVTATAGVKASGNCNLTLINVKITAPIAIEASGNAKVTVTGGSLTSATNSVVADANAQVTVTGAAVTGKAKTSANGKVVGVPTK